MCVLALAWQTHPRWQLVLAGNRDELHDRPAAPLARWTAPAPILAGRDLLSGGTWLGVSEAGRLAVVTNLRGYGPPRADRASRGALVLAMLEGGTELPDDLDRWNPFNLIVAGPTQACFLSNRPHPLRSGLAPGLYGLSNGALDEPWPKTMQIKTALQDWLMQDDGDPATLFAPLASRALPDFGLPPDAPSDVPQEPLLSSVFIRHPVYGTRCSTIVAIDRAGDGLILERRFDAAGATTGETALPFRWPAGR